MGPLRSDRQIASVLKARSLDEASALQECGRINSVLETRQTELAQMIKEMEDLTEELEIIKGSTRPHMLLRGELFCLPGLLKYEKELTKRIKKLCLSISEKKRDVLMAEKRFHEAEGEVLGARLEKKKAEIYLSRSEDQQQLRSEAQSDVEFDDLLNSTRKK